MAAGGSRRHLDVLFVSASDTGHLLPILRIAEGVAKRGHRIRVVTCDYDAQKWAGQVQRLGGELIPVETGYSSWAEADEASIRARTWFFVHVAPAFEECVKRQLEAERPPDVVVSDCMTIGGVKAACDRDVPLLMNLPTGLGSLGALTGLFHSDTHWSFLGLHVARQRMSIASVFQLFNVAGTRAIPRAIGEAYDRGSVWLVNAMWGLEAPRLLPPSIVVTGPLLPPAEERRKGLAAEHPDLHRFLRGAGGRAVYVSTGSMVELRQWQVEALFHGLKRVGCKVVWSLKEGQQEFLPNHRDEDFFVGKWLPQAELLQDEAVAAVVTHCGWGATLECISAGKPMILMPFFGDQPDNAKLLLEEGLGSAIGKLPWNGWSDPSKNPYKPGDVTPETVAEAVTKVMEDSAYREKAQQMERVAEATGGVDLAVQHVEWVARRGTSHLAPPRAVRGSAAYRPVLGCLCGVVSLCVIALGLCAAASHGSRWLPARMIFRR